MSAGPSLSLSGRTALVTGAASGIGRAIALSFARAGAAVVVNHWARSAEADALVHEIAAAGGRAIAIDADVTNVAAVGSMVEATEAALGPIDVLVNCAGIIQNKPFLETTDEDWRRMIDTDLGSVFVMCRAVLPSMVARGQGVVINIASDLGILGRTEFAAYCAAKAGVIGLTRSLAREFAPAIRVNAIAPGPVETQMLSPASMSAEWIAKEKDIPQARFAAPEEIAATALFLAGDMARFYCRQVLGPNGGSVMP